MPNITADINKCTIDEDQLRVASLWAKTFVHNPTDLATTMTQLVMACVAKGDFGVRGFMSTSDELAAPSRHLTIADYLSHASRIIIDYYSLSEPYAKELLAYFPHPDETNKVFSRSATHDVNQINDKTVEGKGVMLGMKGQLPAVLKTPKDFGLNIAMGGLGQDNFQGKKIADNGFSGHFYYHLNPEQQLLLAGLEQSAPAASVFDALKTKEQYPEEVQQGRDQFGQGHSLTGASDTYTAAGSLYFSSPVYQAKLMLEKGVFPPEKYGAMQVTLSDGLWADIKECLDQLAQAAKNGQLEQLTALLLEKPVKAKDAEPTYKSFVALDFKTYLKQSYTVFIDNSTLEEADKSNLSSMQKQLLNVINELQYGNIAVYNEFEQILTQLDSNIKIPVEYKQAVSRIHELFNRQLEIDPELKNTQIQRPYKLGDYTRSALKNVAPKDYEFGDITWALKNRAKAYRVGDISKGLLSQVGQLVNGNSEPYHPGDITKGLFRKTRNLLWRSEPTPAQPEGESNIPQKK